MPDRPGGRRQPMHSPASLGRRWRPCRGPSQDRRVPSIPATEGRGHEDETRHFSVGRSSAGLTRLPSSVAVISKTLRPLCPLVRVEVIECAEDGRPWHGAVARVVFVWTEGPGDRFERSSASSRVASIKTLIPQTVFSFMRSSLLDTGGDHRCRSILSASATDHLETDRRVLIGFPMPTRSAGICGSRPSG